MNEAPVVEHYSDVQFLRRKMHEDNIAGAQLITRQRAANEHKVLRPARQQQPGLPGRVHDEAAAIKAAGRSTAVAIRLGEHRERAVDEHARSIPARSRRLRFRRRLRRHFLLRVCLRCKWLHCARVRQGGEQHERREP